MATDQKPRVRRELTSHEVADIRRCLRVIERTRRRIAVEAPQHTDLIAELKAVTTWGHRLLNRLP